MFQTFIRKNFDMLLDDHGPAIVYLNKNIEKALESKTMTLEGYYRFSEKQHGSGYSKILLDSTEHSFLGSITVNALVERELEDNPSVKYTAEERTKECRVVSIVFTRHSRSHWRVGKFFAVVS